MYMFVVCVVKTVIFCLIEYLWSSGKELDREIDPFSEVAVVSFVASLSLAMAQNHRSAWPLLSTLEGSAGLSLIIAEVNRKNCVRGLTQKVPTQDSPAHMAFFVFGFVLLFQFQDGDVHCFETKLRFDSGS